ncbi:NADH dehydrogenase [Platysternon megacephalum]|uniref:NADH dehydrogenase n=1 Tax=Platysternon megacephalum TaxID=55544 RepID=A0A4D9EQK0_9SAUR|nr:NADH dehydrogenase [Platysternon megacephalum]
MRRFRECLVDQRREGIPGVKSGTGKNVKTSVGETEKWDIKVRISREIKRKLFVTTGLMMAKPQKMYEDNFISPTIIFSILPPAKRSRWDLVESSAYSSNAQICAPDSP